MGRRLGLLLVFLIISFFRTGTVSASHLMGGDLSYRYLGNDRYEINIVMYRDCGSGNTGLDKLIKYGVFKDKDSSLVIIDSIPLLSLQYIRPESRSCTAFKKYCVQQGIYKDTITLGPDSAGYHILYLRTDRNYALLNLQRCINNANPKSCDPPNCTGNKNPFGCVWHAFIPGRKYHNSSPQFLTTPTPYLCAGRKNIFNSITADPDGDSLHFAIVHPWSSNDICGDRPKPDLKNGILSVVFAPGYSAAYPFGPGSPKITIDSLSGEITAAPPVAGNYAIALSVKEYRKDTSSGKVTYLGEIRRDIQFIVNACPAKNPPEFVLDTGRLTQFMQAGKDNCFAIAGKSSTTDTLKIEAIGGILPKYAVFTSSLADFNGTTDTGKITGKFCWKPSCDEANTNAPYLVNFRLSDQSCNVSNTTLKLYVKPVPQFTAPVPLCIQSIDRHSVRISFRHALYDTFAFQRINIYRSRGNDSSFALYDSVTDLKTFSYTDTNALGATDTSYRYYFTALNKCGSESKASRVIRNIILSAKKLSPHRVLLKWNNPLSGSKTFSIYELGKDGKSKSIAQVTGGNSYVYKSCTDIGSFKVDNTEGYSCTSSSLYTDTIDLSGSTLKSPYLIDASVTVPNTVVTLRWSGMGNTDAARVRIYRANARKSTDIMLKEFYSASDTIYTDTFPDITEQYCYRVEYQDSCGNRMASNNGCIILLNGNAAPFINTLKWLPYTSWHGDSQNYTIYKKTDSPGWIPAGVTENNILSWQDENLDQSKTSRCYQVEAIEHGGLFEGHSLSTSLCLQQQPSAWMPDAFSPGVSPELNDVFGPKGAFISHFTINIYNRWGEKIYSDGNSRGWNGRNENGDLLEGGMYIYSVIVYGYDKVPHYFYGKVILLR